jgi:hypothetical protein
MAGIVFGEEKGVSQLKLLMHKVQVSFDSDDSCLDDWLDLSLGGFKKAEQSDKAHVNAKYFNNKDKANVPNVRSRNSVLGSGLSSIGAGIEWNPEPWFCYFVEFCDACINTAFLRCWSPKNTAAFIARRVFAPKLHAQRELNKAIFALRLLIDFPVFWMLDYRRGVGVFHGSAVARDGRCIVLTGLDGCGKSTLAYYLCTQRGYRLVADNFILTDGKRILAFPGAMRLSKDVLAICGAQTGGEGDLGERLIVNTERALGDEEFECAAIILNRFGSRTKLERISSNVLSTQVAAMHGYLPEFIEYMKFCSLLTYANPGCRLTANCSVDQLARSVDCYLLEKGDLSEVGQIADMVEKCL